MDLSSDKVFSSIFMILIGIVTLIFAYSCFTDIPFIGTVFLIPGDNVLNARAASPMFRIGLFLIGLALVLLGIFLPGRIGTNSSLNPSNHNLKGTDNNLNTINLRGIKEAKDLLDAGVITRDEYNAIKSKLIK